MSFLLKMCLFFFFLTSSSLSLSLLLRNQCLRLCALIWPLMTVNLYLFLGEQQWAADTISHQNKESGLCGLWEIHGALMWLDMFQQGPLIREGDSQTCSGSCTFSENWGVQGSWIEIKPQVLLSLSQQGPRYFYLKTSAFSKSFYSKKHFSYTLGPIRV